LAHQLKRRTPGLSYRGFTLIELLVVIAINRGFAENHSASAPR
ncbi:MAG: prepilin-type N-terminal cleavage/methylation domain-containing protein, partial [Pedosphaera sp.]|nr:prepilin-type N-terminal cleavage/methylation domain-containing protein [Pedosphaera sp.]